MIRNLPSQAFLLWSASSLLCGAAPIQNLKFTDVVKDVIVLNVATKKETPAKVGDVLSPPNVIKTGVDSRAELVAEDNTVTRVGANTIFSVEPNSRDVNIGKGSVMFHSPTGKGGGNIKSAGATASVLGTTLIVGANQQGGFKVMLLEGKGQVTGSGGGAVKLNAGQMTFAMPGQAPSQPLNFELKGQVSGSKLVGGFSKPIASIAKIEAAISTQQAQIGNGQLASTGLLIGDSPKEAFKVDAAVIQNVVTLQREKIVKQELPKKTALDPRYAIALANGPLTLRGPAPETDEEAQRLAQHAFTIEIGISRSAAGYGQPSTVPGARPGDGAPSMMNYGGNLAILLARDITLDLPTPRDINTLITNYLLLAPFEEKNYFGMVSLKDITVTKSLEILHPEDVSGKDLLLSAGNTLKLSPNAHLKSGENVPVFHIYTGGYAFSDSLTVEGLLQPLAPPAGVSKQVFDLKLDATDTGGGKRLENPTDDGVLSISAPQIALDRVDLYANGRGGSIRIEARDGELRIGSDEVAALSSSRPFVDRLRPEEDPDGDRPNLLAANLTVISRGPLKLLGATIEADNFSLQSGSTIEINNVLFSNAKLDPAQTNTSDLFVGKMEALGDITIFNTDLSRAAALSISSATQVTLHNVDLPQFTPDWEPTPGWLAKNASEKSASELDFDLPIGFDSANQLAVSAPIFKIQSTGRAITLRGVFIESNRVTLEVSDSETDGIDLSKVAVRAKAAVPTNSASTNDTLLSLKSKGDILIGNPEQPGYDMVLIQGISSVNVDSLANQALLYDVAIRDTDSVSISAEKDVTFQDVSVASGRALREATKVIVSSRDGNVVMDGNFSTTNANRHATDAAGRKIIQSKTVSIVSRVALDSDGVPMTEKPGTTDAQRYTGSNDNKGNLTVRNYAIKADQVYMSAKEQLELNNVQFAQLSAAQQVNLTARTTVLRNVVFADGSTLWFKVAGAGGNLVAGNFGYRNTVEPGLLNIMSGVKYGTVDIVQTGGSDNTHLTATQFQTALPAAIPAGRINVSQR